MTPLSDFFCAHEAQRARTPKDLLAEYGDARVLLERELAEIMLADKERQTGEDFGARPRNTAEKSEINFRPTMENGAPRIVGDDLKLRRRTPEQERATAQFIAAEAEKCANVFRAAIFQIALDLETKWGATKRDKQWSQMYFQSPAPHWLRAREELCALAGFDPDALLTAYRNGALSNLSHDAIGQKRWETRRLNMEATAEQPDLFRGRGR